MMYYLAAVVNDSNDAISLQDKTDQIIAWNRVAEKKYGYGEIGKKNFKNSDILFTTKCNLNGQEEVIES